jgi:hypothetical protein
VKHAGVACVNRLVTTTPVLYPAAFAISKRLATGTRRQQQHVTRNWHSCRRCCTWGNAARVRADDAYAAVECALGTGVAAQDVTQTH